MDFSKQVNGKVYTTIPEMVTDLDNLQGSIIANSQSLSRADVEVLSGQIRRLQNAINKQRKEGYSDY